MEPTIKKKKNEDREKEREEIAREK